MRDILKQNMEKRNDVEILNLLIDVYKIHKKCIKHMVEKEMIFSQLLVDVYKFYIEDKVLKMPETTSMLDLAVRLCLHEISARKNQQKQAMNVGAFQNTNTPTIPVYDPTTIPMATKLMNTTATSASFSVIRILNVASF